MKIYPGIKFTTPFRFRFIRYSIAATFACLAGVSSTLSTVHAQGISGTIVDGDNRVPIAAALVTFTDTLGKTFTTTTNSTGDYNITSLANGEYSVSASSLPTFRETYWTGQYDSSRGTNHLIATIPPGASYVNISLHHYAGATFSGSVVDSATMQPIIGAFIQGTTNIGEIIWSTYSDSSGNFSKDMTKGTYVVYVSVWGFVSATPETLVIAAGATAHSFRLAAIPTVVISGSVQTDSGSAIASARITVRTSVQTDTGFVYRTTTTTTDSSGEYSISVLAKTYNTVEAAATGFITHTGPQYVYASSNEIANFILYPAPSGPTRLSGKIMGCSGSDLYMPGTVYAFPLINGVVGDNPTSVAVDTSDTFEFTGLTVGHYYLWFISDEWPPDRRYAPDYYSNPSCTGLWQNAIPIEVAANQQLTGLDIRVQSSGYPSGPCQIFGTITVMIPSIVEVPLDSVTVCAKDANGKLLALTITDKKGAFTLPNLSKQTYYLSVDRVGYDVLIRDSIVSFGAQDSLKAERNMTMVKRKVVGVDPTSLGRPDEFLLRENFPNPFEGQTNVLFTTCHAGAVTLDVRDVLGRVVSTIVSGTMAEGNHAVQFNAENLPAGMYFTRLAKDGYSVVKPMVIKR